MTGATPSPAFPRWLAIVAFTIFLDLLGFGIVLPALPYYALRFHASETEVTLLGTTYAAMQLLFVPIWGRLSDRIGRRPVLLFSIVGTIAGMTVFALASSLVALYAARIVAGAMTANFATAQAYVADLTPPSGRARAMGIVGASLGMGFIVGPPLGGLLADVGRHTGIGYPLLGWVSAGLSLLNLGLAAVMLPESLSADLRRSAASRRGSRIEGLRIVRRSGALVSVVALQAVVTFAFSAMEWTFTLLSRVRLGWTEEVGGDRWNGLSLGFVGLVMAITQAGMVGRLVKRFGEPAVLRAGLLFITAGLACCAATFHVATMIVSCALLAIGFGLVSPTMSALVSQNAPPDAQGEVIGIYQAAGSFARVFGPVTGGILFQRISPSGPFVLGATAVALAALAAWRTLGRPVTTAGA
ncbi:MAG: MFS transporter [Deltaproteobacteria bacterium]|nr:MFS transporter [Deltaproteobacteria bacterium]